MSVHAAGRERRTTIRDLLEMKARGEKIVALTAYDVLFGRIVDAAGADLVLVGDSLGNVVCGYDSTVPVTLDQIIHHGRASAEPHTELTLSFTGVTKHGSNLTVFRLLPPFSPI